MKYVISPRQANALIKEGVKLDDQYVISQNINEDNQKLQTENSELKKKLDLAVEGLGFYGNWANSCEGKFHASDCEVMDVHNPLEHDKNGVLIGGKRARQALKEIKEIWQ